MSSLHSFNVVNHAKAYGIFAEQIENGSDLQLIAERSKRAIEYIRAEKRPYLLEINTYRYRQHVGPDEDYEIGYRDRFELEKWLKKDPLIQDKPLIRRFQTSIATEIDEAIDFAEQAPLPDQTDLYKDVY